MDEVLMTSIIEDRPLKTVKTVVNKDDSLRTISRKTNVGIFKGS